MLKRALAALIFFGAALSQNPSPSAGQAQSRPPEKKPTSQQQNAQPEQRGTDQAPFIVKVLPTPQTNEKSAEGASKQPEKSPSDWTTSDLIAGIAAVAGLLQAAALIVTILVLMRTSRRQLRAYVLPEGGALTEGMMLDPPMPAHAGEPGVILLFKNSGQTPAYRHVNWGAIAVTEPANAHTLVPPALDFRFPATIGAGGTINKALWFGRPLTTSEVADIQAAAKYIFVYGRLEYRDAFRRKRWSTFRLQYAGKFPPPKGVTFNFSDTGNESN